MPIDVYYVFCIIVSLKVDEYFCGPGLPGQVRVIRKYEREQILIWKWNNDLLLINMQMNHVCGERIP